MNRIGILFLMLTNVTGILAQTSAYEFKPSGKPIVQVFGTASFEIEENRYNFDFGRAHIGYQYQFSPDWSSKIILDRGRATSVGEIMVTDSLGNSYMVQNNSTEGAYYTMFLKFASLQWKVNDKLTLEGGAILQDHYITQERFWGFRYVAQTFQDLYWKIPSSDLGFIAHYKFNDVVSVDAAITNGEGPRKIQDAFGKVKFAGGLSINPSEKVQTRVFYHNRQSKTNIEKTEQMLSFFAGYKPIPLFRLGGEFNYMANLNNISKLNSYGFSLYSAYQVSDKTELFVRFDRLLNEVPDLITKSNMNNGNALMGGISHAPVKGVNLSFNYRGWLPDETANSIESSIALSIEFKF